MSLLHSLMTILQFCNGSLSPTSPLGSTISRNLINCFRVQKSALDVLAALSEKKGELIFAFLTKTILQFCVFLYFSRDSAAPSLIVGPLGLFSLFQTVTHS